MWPPPKQITLEVLFQAWKDQAEITKALAEVDFVLDSDNEEDTYDRLLVEGKHEAAEIFWNR
jgi:antitoxin component HigA of HigAB toxin-antitoxin module